MTIVAGFKCSDGVVLAADTQISYLNTFSYESKILDISGGFHHCYIAYSGDVLLTKEVKEELQKTVKETTEERLLAKAIKSRLGELHKEHFTSVKASEKSALQMLVAIRAEEEWALYLAVGKRFLPVETYELLGAGEDIGRATFESRYTPNLTIKEGQYLAAYGLSIIKRFVKGCGGDSSICLFENDWLGATPQQTENIADLEKDFLAFENAVTPMLLSLTTFYADDTFENHTKSFLKGVRAIRKKEEQKLRKILKQEKKNLRKKIHANLFSSTSPT